MSTLLRYLRTLFTLVMVAATVQPSHTQPPQSAIFIGRFGTRVAVSGDWAMIDTPAVAAAGQARARFQTCRAGRIADGEDSFRMTVRGGILAGDYIGRDRGVARRLARVIREFVGELPVRVGVEVTQGKLHGVVVNEGLVQEGQEADRSHIWIGPSRLRPEAVAGQAQTSTVLVVTSLFPESQRVVAGLIFHCRMP